MDHTLHPYIQAFVWFMYFQNPFFLFKSPPNFLRASALAEHVKPMVVIPDEEELEEQEEDEPEPLVDVREAQPSMASQPQVLARNQ